MVVGVEDAFGMRVLVFVGDRADLWHQVVAVGVEVPVFLRSDVGRVRFDKPDRQEERLVLFLAEFLQRAGLDR